MVEFSAEFSDKGTSYQEIKIHQHLAYVIRNFKFEKAAENVVALNKELEERNKKSGRGNPSKWPLKEP